LFVDIVVDDIIGRMRACAGPAIPVLRGVAGVVACLRTLR
jgi:hypothetical protein